MPGLNVSNKGGQSFDPIPQGIHAAICVHVAYLGTQLKTFKGQEKEICEVRLDFEVPSQTYEVEDKDGTKTVNTRTIGMALTASLNEKAKLRNYLESWRGRAFTEEELEGFQMKALVGIPCTLQIFHSEDGKYANIKNILPAQEGIQMPAPTRDLVSFDFQFNEKDEMTGFDEEAFAKLPKFIKTKICESVEFVQTYGENCSEHMVEGKAKIEEATAEDVAAVFPGGAPNQELAQKAAAAVDGQAQAPAQPQAEASSPEPKTAPF